MQWLCQPIFLDELGMFPITDRISTSGCRMLHMPILFVENEGFMGRRTPFGVAMAGRPQVKEPPAVT